MCPGQRSIPTVRIDPSQGSPSSPRHGPAEAMKISSGRVLVVVGPLSETNTTMVSWVIWAVSMASRIRPTLWSSSMMQSP